MAADYFDWTPARIEELVRLWREGHDASAIAALWGTTRNMVLGKVHRLRRHPGGEERFARRAAPRPSKPKPKPKPKPKRSHRPKLEPPAPRPPVRVLPLPPAAGPLTLLRLRADSCRWILGEVRGPETLFCGRAQVEGGSYCGEHLARCLSHYRAATAG